MVEWWTKNQEKVGEFRTKGCPVVVTALVVVVLSRDARYLGTKLS